jgi:high-affinity nickel-transport protein
MPGSVGLVLLGFLLGVRHALDPDHVVAVGTISTSAPSVRRSVAVGALWGVGHTLTVLAVGGAIVLLRFAVSPRAALAMEFSVALMLIALGLLNLLSVRHSEPAAPSPVRPLVVGMVHGMAGSAPLRSSPRPPSATRSAWPICFLGLGTIADDPQTALLVHRLP